MYYVLLHQSLYLEVVGPDLQIHSGTSSQIARYGMPAALAESVAEGAADAGLVVIITTMGYIEAIYG